MLESLSRIQNLFVRSLTAAATIGSMATMASAIALGTTNAKSQAAYQTALYAALAGTGCGAVIGLLYPEKNSQKLKQIQQLKQIQSVADYSWKNWRNFVVIHKVKESEEITSFYLQPEDRESIPNFQPGQFLTIKLDISGQASAVIRTYSLSDYTEPCEYYRLSIKREPSPSGSNFMPGIASNFMHDQVHEGSIIAVKPPAGKFVLDVQKSLPAVLISNGVGITPMMSMAKAATLNSKRSIWFVHGARNGRFHAFRDEVAAIAKQNPKLHVHFAYSRPELDDTGYYHSTGYVDIKLIKSLVNQDAEYFLCGSPAFMRSLREGLTAAGVAANQIFFEAFTKGTSKTPESQAIAQPNQTIDYYNQETNAHQAEIVFANSGKTAIWQANDGSLLEFAEANNLQPAYSCRQGICGTCTCQILEGEVEYQELPVATIEDGSILICVSQPKTPRVILGL
ncbi:MAG: 2Fe-2S iron-sulfur cluster-binding protein [Elainellaceae cyanobacterium]